MTALTDAAENLLLNWAFTTGAVLRPAAWEVALHTADPTETGAVGELLVATDADYVRKAITMGASTTGQSASTSAVSWTVNSGSAGFTITHASVWDVTNSICLIKGALLIPRVMVANGVLTFDIGEVLALLD